MNQSYIITMSLVIKFSPDSDARNDYAGTIQAHIIDVEEDAVVQSEVNDGTITITVNGIDSSRYWLLITGLVRSPVISDENVISRVTQNNNDTVICFDVHPDM